MLNITIIRGRAVLNGSPFLDDHARGPAPPWDAGPCISRIYPTQSNDAMACRSMCSRMSEAASSILSSSPDVIKGSIRWTWQGPATLSMPAVADMDGDGMAEVLVMDEMGTLFCLDDGARE